MSQYGGFATMYMRMPMSTSTLPVQGSCSVDERRIVLKFPFTVIEFDLPSIPDEEDIEFIIRSSRGSDMTMTISHLPELKAYAGVGREGDDSVPVLSFYFFPPDSPLSLLPKS